jgi:hypothetical protein
MEFRGEEPQLFRGLLGGGWAVSMDGVREEIPDSEYLC